MTASNTMAKRAAAGTLALAVCLTGGLVSAGAANAAAGFTFENNRISGEDRYDTAVAASKAAFSGTADSIVITNGTSEVDGLTASYVAGLHNGPILYTKGADTFTAATSTEMNRLSAKTVYIVGGTTVVSAAVETQLKAKYGDANVIRYGGSDRYETASKVAQSGTTKPGKVIVANGASYADALVAGPIAYAKKYPILLTASTGVPAFTSDALTKLGVTTVDVIGGAAVVTDATYTAVGGDIRLGGENRQETAVKVAAEAIANEGFKSDSVALVGNTNVNAADALVAAPLAGINGVPILFIDNTTITATNTYLSANSAKLTGKGYVFGGTTAVPTASVAAAATAAATAPPATGLQAYTFTGGGSYVTGGTTTANPGDVTYTVAGKAGDRVKVVLFNGDNVSVDATGATLLARTSTSATAGSVNASLKTINGIAVTGATQDVTIPASGTLTIVVHRDALSGAGSETVVPVVYSDTNANGALNVGTEATSSGKPVEAFGIGLATTFVPVESAAGTINSTTVALVDKTAGFFTTAAGGRYKLAAADSYNFATNPSTGVATQADFLARISKGDTISGTYGPLTTSSFTLNDTTPAAPAVSAAVVSPGSTVRLTITNVADADSYNIYRHVGSDAAFSTSAYSKVGNVAASKNASVSFDDAVALPTGTNVQYFVRSVKDGSEGPLTGTGATGDNVDVQLVDSSAVSNPRPTSTLTGFTDNGLSSNIDSGDVIRIKFSAPLSAPAAGATIRLTDQNTTPTISDLVNGSNATFSINANTISDSTTFNGSAAGTVLTVTVTGAPVAATAGSTVGLQTPATITASSGIGSAAGATWDIAGSPSSTPGTPASAETQQLAYSANYAGGTLTLTAPGGGTANILTTDNNAAIGTKLDTAYGVPGITVTGTTTKSVVFPTGAGNVAQISVGGSPTDGTTPITVTASTTTSGVNAAPATTSGTVIGG